ncbi:MAG: hypothetical protein NUV51_09285 [Sulfuricaulis sp.]|nr:hypothetical protein [Sulfuricaulis sp.]
MTDVKEVKKAEAVAGSMAEIEAANNVEYDTIPGFKLGQTLRIGSLSAGDLIVWSEANEGEAKRTAGLRLITQSLVGPEPDNVRYANDPKNIVIFRAKTHKTTEAVVKAILKLNGMEVAKGEMKAEADAKNG